MTSKNNIEELYLLIINSLDKHQTFIDNLDLWETFYNNRHILIDKNLLNPKLFTIIGFLLEQEKGEIFDYFHSEILNTLYHKQAQLTYELMNSDTKKNEDINKLFANLINHDNLCALISKLQINDPFGEVKEYTSKILQLDTADALTEILFEQLFSSSPEITKKALDFITKTTISIQNTELKNNPINKDLLPRYLTQIIPIKIFMGENISNEQLIKLIKSYQVKEENVITSLFLELPLETILTIFNGELNNIIDFLNNADYLDDNTKRMITIKTINGMIESEDYPQSLLNFIIKGNSSTFLEENLYICFYNIIMISSLNNAIYRFNSDSIKFLLTSTYQDSTFDDKEEKEKYSLAKKKFITECRYLLRNTKYLQSKENFDIEGIKKLLLPKNNKYKEEEIIIHGTDNIKTKEIKANRSLELGINIDFKVAIELLKNYLENKITLSKHSMQVVIRSIAEECLNKLNIPNNGIYYHNSHKTNGIFDSENLFISLNTLSIDKLLNNKSSMCNRLSILTTTFHEITHAILEQNRKNNIFNNRSYEMTKQDIMRKYDFSFYDKNYEDIKEEIEARINGIDCTIKFIETFMPELLDQIQDEMIKELEEEKQRKNNPSTETMYFFKYLHQKFNLAFDFLIRCNPNILIKHPILNLEYYPNGTPKTAEDLLSSKNKENSEIIDEIIKTRYPHVLFHQEKAPHHK